MNFVNDSIIKAVSWTLIHSLWLGLVLALLAGLIILLTKKATSAYRYNALAVLCVLFLVTIGFTLNYELKLYHAESVSHLSQLQIQDYQTGVTSPAVSFPAATQELSAGSFTVQVNSFVNNYASWIVCLWFMIFSFKCFTMINEIRHIYRVRNYQTITPPEIWQNRLLELKTLLNITRRIQLLESKLVTVPSVTGFFKPIILIPIGLINNLPQEQVEAILLHELAHIRRSDYVVNLVQSCMEILFFFNPGVLWISSLLKDERENCCDDLAIGVTQNKKEFVHALVSFHEYNLAGHRLSMQFGNRKMHLTDRAKRILFNHNKMLNTVEKCFLSVCIALGTTLCFAFANMDARPENPVLKRLSALPPDSLLISDTLYANRKYDPAAIPEGTSLRFSDIVNEKEYITYLFKYQGILYQVPQDLRTLMVNGKLVKGSERKAYLPVLQSLIDEYDLKAIEDKNARVIEESDRVAAESDRIAAESDRIAGESDYMAAESARIENESRRLEAESRKIEAESKRIEAESRRIEAESRRIEEASKPGCTPPPKAESEDITETVITALKKSGFESRSKEIHSFELGEKRLIVNGTKQSDALHEKMKRYIEPGMRILYNIETN